MFVPAADQFQPCKSLDAVPVTVGGPGRDQNFGDLAPAGFALHAPEMERPSLVEALGLVILVVIAVAGVAALALYLR